MRTLINVLVSDATRMHCDLLRKAFFSVRNRFRVVAFATTATEVLSALQTHRPQVAIISSDMQDGPLSGIRILSEIRRSYPLTKTIAMLPSAEKELVIDAFRSGAVGVFSRNSRIELLFKSIEVVSRGQIWANAEELHHVLNAFAKSSKPRKLDPTVEGRVTRREAAVVRLAVEGLSNREIAQQLALTEHTVKNYLFRVFDKLGVSNRVELVLSCLDQEENARGGFLAAKELAPRKALPVERQITALKA